MEIPADYLNKKFQPDAHKPRSAREEILQNFLTRLNPGRKEKKLKPLTYPRIATLLQGIPTEHLYPFYRQCENARVFSAYFWWALKPAKV